LLGLGVYARDWFEVAHLYAWQLVFLAVVGVCWLSWVLRVCRVAWAAWRPALLRFVGALVVGSLVWAAATPLHARGLGLLARPFIGVVEGDAGTTYSVEGGRLVAHRTVWLPKQKRMAPLTQPLWVGVQSFGLPLLAALLLATPGWSWKKRGRALTLGFGLWTLTQIAQLFVTIEASQQSSIMSVDGPIQLTRYSAARQPVFYCLYYFFELMGRGFFALLIYAALIAFLGDDARATAGAGRNAPCPCGSGRKYKRCHGR
jgi:hypothetical protein